MPVRSAEAEWNGNLRQGRGRVSLESKAFEGQYSFGSRFEEGTGTNPEELIAAAHAGCFSMALAAGLSKAGHEPQSVRTTARVQLEKRGEAFEITTIELETEARVPGLEDAEFQKHAETAKATCPVSKALAGTEIRLAATLVQ